MAAVSGLLELENAHARLGGVEVLKGASFVVRPGEVVALCGPNGAGKSTAVRAALGLAPLTEGTARLGDHEARRLSERQRGERAAYLPQDRSIAWNLPAVEVAALGAPFLTGGAALERARAALDEVGVGHLADRGVADMSGGERARVLLARALTVPAPLLVADEPIAGLDPDAQLLVLERLRARADAGRGVLVSLHDLSLAARFADRVVVLDQGRTAAEGAPTEALSPSILKTVFNLDAVWLEASEGPWLAARRASHHG
ncbi:ABC transporter ATP-binding protein [Brevundimonas naejangsanensis]|nr:ABC transporter ATP-binding protein [Brevundimonas naejangsanensis]QBQ48108.1 ABC transporter ATP-binding protein [Brevundimonas naejangsanensis]